MAAVLFFATAALWQPVSFARNGLAATLDDPAITDAVEREFIVDSAVPVNAIDVRTEDGIVTLEGVTHYILAHDRAARIAETVKGVRSVINRIEVKPLQTLTGPELEENVRQALRDDPATETAEVLVQANTDGKVKLSGTVDSWEKKRLCGLAARNVKGVVYLANDIRVDYSRLNRTDAEMAAEIKRKLDWDRLVDGSLVEVSVTMGKAKLSGTVGSAAEKRRARNGARVAGVTDVDDSAVEVDRWARDDDLRTGKYVRRSAEQIRSAIEDAFRYDPRIFADDIRVTVSDDGRTRLDGIVTQLQAKQAAATVARNTVGVRSVNNWIRVRPDRIIRDETIEKEVASRLQRDPTLTAPDIDVRVDSGTVHLRGKVQNFYEKARATAAASGARGVESVKNHLAVIDETPNQVLDPYLSSYDMADFWEEFPDYLSRAPRGSRAWKQAEELEGRIEAELFWSPFVDSEDVEVFVDGSTARLVGTVDSQREKEDATKNALDAGAAIVDNDLAIRE